jgi:tetratricopeptide (TPR) repeat protein
MEDLATIGHDEESLAEADKLLPLLRSQGAQIAERARRIDLPYDSAARSLELGDFEDAVAQERVAEQLADYSSSVESARLNEIEALGFQHDSTGVARRLRALSPANEPKLANAFDIEIGRVEFELGNGDEAIRRLGRAQVFSKASPKYVSSETDVFVTPLLATAEAEIGRHADAFQLIGATPLDCMSCVLMRGRIDEAIGNTKGAAYWYADAEKQARSLPMPDTYWGRMLLDQGRIDEAIDKFRSANQKGPHFADPLEMWGEALIDKNRSDLALAKFEEADKYAPNWGRLHLKWGEALLWSGDKAGAQKQFAAAAALDLASAEKAELARLRSIHG